MTTWRDVTLGEIAAPDPHALATGPFGSAISSRHFVEAGVPVIRGSNLSLDVGNRLADTQLAFLSQEKALSFKRSIARRGDLVFTCWGTIGQVGLVDDRAAFDEYVVSNKQMKLTPDRDQVDSLYLYYLLSSPAMVEAVQQQAIGAAVPGFNLGQLRQIRIRLPDLAFQRNAASVLGRFDDLIENSRRRIQLLEEMVKAIYREWFVSFGYPGSEGVEVIHSSVGAMPATWGITRLSEHVRLRRDNVRPDSSPSESFFHYSIPAFDDRRLPVCEPGDAIRSGKYLLDGECVLLSKLNPRFPRVWRVTPPETGPRAVCSTEFLVLDCGLDWPVPFVYAVLTSPEFGSRLSELAGGTSTSHQRAKPADVMALALPEPPRALVQRFAEVAGPMLSVADNLVLQIDQLSQLRDLLLPKLVSGQIDVSGLALDAALEATG
ncbi:MAG TPA: restriction endonuclease subunit S [Acidimicrobiales bacterium]|nr:restriction endonuclease subunit S [Acidimicrobiales bacterium]